VLRYIELKSGYSDNGPAWIARVSSSRSGQTVYFDGKALKRAQGSEHYDSDSGDTYWISGVKQRGTNRHPCGSGKIQVEAAAVPELLVLRGATTLDTRLFEITTSIRATDPADFVERENALLDEKLAARS